MLVPVGLVSHQPSVDSRHNIYLDDYNVNKNHPSIYEKACESLHRRGKDKKMIRTLRPLISPMID